LSAIRNAGCSAVVLVALAVAGAPPASAGGTFSFPCGYSHSSLNDPIVFRGQLGASHQHDFLGNRSTNASSTYASLRRASTACTVYGDSEADKSAYWFPTLLERQADGTFAERRAFQASVYYNGNAGTEPFPPGMKMVAGNAHATVPQPGSIVHWSCVNGGIAVDASRPWCVEDGVNPYPPGVRMTLRFPQCWDGVTTDWNYTRHMAYPVAGRCPPGYPRRVPEILIFVSYATAGGPDADTVPSPGAVKLSSGGHFSGHGDFFNGWDPTKLGLLMERCIHLALC
jgi:hypothetical protein